MALSIKSAEADELARQLAETTGESITAAVIGALRERLERERGRSAAMIVRRLEALSAEFSSLPAVDPRTPDEIIGYDEHGLPT